MSVPCDSDQLQHLMGSSLDHASPFYLQLLTALQKVIVLAFLNTRQGKVWAHNYWVNGTEWFGFGIEGSTLLVLRTIIIIQTNQPIPCCFTVF